MQDNTDEIQSLEKINKQLHTDSEILRTEGLILKETLVNMKNRQRQLREEMETQRIAVQSLEIEKDYHIKEILKLDTIV